MVKLQFLIYFIIIFCLECNQIAKAEDEFSYYKMLDNSPVISTPLKI